MAFGRLSDAFKFSNYLERGARAIDPPAFAISPEKQSGFDKAGGRNGFRVDGNE